MKFFKFSLKFFFVIVIFLYGVGIGRYELFPFEEIKTIRNIIKYKALLKFDKSRRLIYTSRHKETPCPVQTKKLGVIVAFGQSNSANYAQHLFEPKDLQNVFNYFDGKCYTARSPLLGADGAKGEWMSLTASNLIKNGVYEKIIIVSSSIGDTSIKLWAKGNYLNKMFIEVITNLSKEYSITDFIFHQGEADKKTYGYVYEFYFKTLIESIRNVEANAPIFISVATNCGAKRKWKYPNEISETQLSLTKLDGIELGINTDEKIPFNLRYDKCHFGKLAQEIAADELANSISYFHKLK